MKPAIIPTSKTLSPLQYFPLFLIICMSLLQPNRLLAQADFQLMCGDTQSEGFYSVAEVPGNGYVMTGSTYSFGAGSEDIFLTRTDATGNILWTKTYGGADVDLANSVTYVPGSGFVIAGASRSFTGINFDGYLLMTDLNGNPVWSFSMPAPGQDEFQSVVATSDGGFMIAGTVSGNHCQIKVSSSGSLQWTRSVDWNGADAARSVLQTADGGYASVGFVADGVTGSTDITVLKTNPQGDTLWTRRLGGPGFDEAESIKQTSDGGFIIAGNSTNFPGGGASFYLIKLDPSGNVTWSKAGGGVGNDFLEDVTETALGYSLLGYSQSFGAGSWESVLIGTDTGGNLIWQNSYGTSSSDYPRQIITTSDGYLALAGESYGGPFGQTDGFLIKTDNGGSAGCSGFSAFSLSTVSTPSGGLAPSIGTAGTLSAVTFTSGSVVLPSQFLCLNGIAETDEYAVTLSPNPFSESITINLNQTVEDAVATLSNLTGQTVYRHAAQAGSRFTLLPPPLPAGMYVLEIFSNNRILHRGKVVRE